VANDAMQNDGSDLSVTLAPLVEDDSGSAIKATLDRIAAIGVRHVQVAATMPGLRPRDLDRTGRRDFASSLRRRELTLSGLDAWIPAEHFEDPARADRAATTISDIISLAADLDRVPVSMVLPAVEEIAVAIIEQAQRAGVEIADHSIPLSARSGVGHGIDPAAWLSHNKDPVAAVHAAGSRLVGARLVDLFRSGLRGPAGSPHEGRLDVDDYKIALSVNGYRRPVVIDARQWNDAWSGIEQSIRAWNQAAAV
jgi:sugar phosphate isomerase/epimerase